VYAKSDKNALKNGRFQEAQEMDDYLLVSVRIPGTDPLSVWPASLSGIQYYLFSADSTIRIPSDGENPTRCILKNLSSFPPLH